MGEVHLARDELLASDEWQRAVRLLEDARQIVPAVRLQNRTRLTSIRIGAPDSVAGRVFFSKEGSPEYRMWMMNQYHQYVKHEVVPAIRKDCNDESIGLWAAGASIGDVEQVVVRGHLVLGVVATIPTTADGTNDSLRKDLLLFGYNVFLGLKSTTAVSDVFGLYRLVDGEVQGNGDRVLTSARTLEHAEADHLSFLDSDKYLQKLQQSRAGAVVKPAGRRSAATSAPSS